MMSRKVRGFPAGSTAIKDSSRPTVEGCKSLTATGAFSGYTPPVTVTPSPTWRSIPMGWSLPLPVTLPYSRPLASASYNTWRTKSSSQTGPRSSMALQTGRKADSFSSVIFTVLKPASNSLTMSSHSFPHCAICSPFWLITISVIPVVLVN